jgi:hypothetical protein
MISTEDKIRSRTEGSQRKRGMITLPRETVPRIQGKCISIIRGQQRREVIWTDTTVCPPNLPSTKTVCEALEEDLENEADLGGGVFPWKHY